MGSTDNKNNMKRLLEENGFCMIVRYLKYDGVLTLLSFIMRFHMLLLDFRRAVFFHPELDGLD